MGKTFMLTFYFGLVSSIIGRPSNTNSEPDRSRGPSGLDSIQNTHHIIKELTNNDNVLINYSDGSEYIVNNLNSQNMSVYEKHRILNGKSEIKLPSKCHENTYNEKKINEKIYINLTTKLQDILKFDVIHDVFDTSKGLIYGLLYKVRLEAVSSTKLKSFIIQTVSQDGISLGNFFSYNSYSQLPFSWIQTKNFQNILQDDQKLKDDDSTCLNNIWSGDFKNNSTATAFWISNQFYDSVNATEFRIYLRLKTNSTHDEETIFFKKIISLKIKKECNLWLKNSSGIVDYTFLPLYGVDCKINFPSFDEVSFSQPPEYLIKLNRLNIPCDSGSYIQFTNKQKMCGKLEELNENELTYYFSIYENISIQIFKNAVFSLHYNLVDYCYNKTVTDMNSTFYIKPIRDSLECYIKIHLPYGNKINVTILTNYANNELINDLDDINFEHVLKNNNFSNTNVNDLVKANFSSSFCDGIFIAFIEGDYMQWHNCVQERNKIKQFSYISTSNILVIHAKKYSVIEKYRDVILNTNILPSVLLTYKFESIPEIVADCAYGWISIQQFCVTTVEKIMTWEDGEEYCSTIGGHLASIRTESDQKLIDEMIQNSPRYHKYFAYWIGGSDKRLEGEYKWSDGLPFQYSNWFPGWSQHNHYNKQPNDDGLSNQDCIELRKYFRTPPGNRQSPAVPFSESFMWNDRDCDAKNYIVCESEIFENKLKSSWMNDCNKTVALTNESPKASIWSPSFPRQYPDNANCYTTVTAPKGYKIVVEFEELVTENEPGCSYDFLEITESIGYEDNKHSDDEYRPNQSKFVQIWNKYKNRDSYEHFTSSNNHEMVQTIYQNLLFSTLYKPQFNYLIRTPNYPKGNILYQNNTSQENIPEKICGDWSSKLKLLRYVSRNTHLGFHFVSDYSHNFGGYKAKVFIENSESECTDNRLTSYNNFCYLFVSYPEVDWWTAQQICKGMGAQLTSVSAISEQRFITTSIRNQADYTPQALYWLGAEFVHSGEFEWTDNTKMSFQGWFPGDDSSGISFTDSTCLGLQWKKSTTSTLPSGLYWKSDKCRKLGGYICKRKRPHYKYFELRNETVFGTEGRLTSPGYPGLYPVNTDYWIHIVAAERSRIIVQFQKIDLEPQDECLYDFISIQNYDQVSKILLEPGINIIPMAMLKSEGNIESNQYERDRMYFLHRSRRSYNNDRPKNHMYATSKNIKHLSNKFQSFSQIKNRKNISSFKWRNIKRNYKRDIVSQIKQSSPSFLPYVRWCGQHDSNMSKFDFVSISNEIIINFHSDYSISGVGFAAVWKTIDMSGCPKQSFTSPEGVVSSPNYPHFLINNIDCTYVIQAPSGKRVRLEFQDFDILEETVVYIDIGSNVFQPYLKKNHINEGIFVSLKEQIKIQIKTAQKPRGKGFQAIYKTVGSTIQERVIHLSNYTKGYLYRLNYPEKVPENMFFSQHLIAPLGDIILLEIYDVEFSTKGCSNNSKIEIFDYYADTNGTKWILCKNTKNPNSVMDNSRIPINSEHELAPVHITSYMNAIHIIQSTTDNTFLNFNATIRIQEDINFKFKLISGDELVESCQHHPCLHNGKCKTHGNKIKCECYGHFTGRFCALNLCEVEPCVFGKCELTLNNFKCHCQPGYIGSICDQKQNPCADNPCEGRGECFVKNGVFTCRCHAWWEGRKCERRMLHIPYKPLSERMLQEPFWLGLITVFIVLAFIGLVWCAKRHFPEKIEKLLAEEADRNRPPGSVSGHHHTSLREQLQFTSSIPQGTSINLHGQSRSIFNRLGIRKPSLLSLSSPYPSAEATARTFSLDDLLQPLPLRSPSRRTKRNNSTPVKKNAAEKKQILQQLVFPIMKSPAAKLNLDELAQMAENNLKEENTRYFYNEEDKETNKLNTSPSIPPSINDPKLEKKVTFARLLNKVSAEMSGGLVMDFTSHDQNDSKASNLPIEKIFMPNSLPTSLSNSDLELTNGSFKKNYINYKDKHNIPTTSSADSIVAIFRNFASATGNGSSLPTSSISSSIIFSPSATPTPTSPQDNVQGDNDSLTSSMNIPVRFSIDATVFNGTTDIEDPVVDVISAHKTITNTNLLHQPTVHLEIPSNGNNKCLSPIRELPSPVPSPALTPIMPRLQRSITSLILEDPRSAEDYEKIKRKASVNVITTNYAEINYFDSAIDMIQSADYSIGGKSDNKTFELDDLPADAKTFRPHDLIIPTLLLEHPSPTKNSVPMILFPGSLPPQRAVIIDETSFIFPKKQKRILQQCDKSTSLDLPFVPPRITITSNENGVNNDSNSIVSKENVSGTSLLGPENSAGMSYLSPFAMGSRADRTISESNLSSSGYSSMASPGPSRCSSGNPLYSNEMEEPGTTQSESNFQFHSSLFNRGQYSILSIFKESNNNSNQISSNGNINQIRLRSDSETLSDDAILESNDEGISTDHIDERNEDSNLSKIKVFENNTEADIVIKKISTADNSSMEQLQIPLITIHNDGNDKGISPVSSRSESSLSEKAGMCRFSSQFYGQKDHQLPFTDSDGLYDFPSSDGKRVSNTHPRRSSSKKRDRKFSKCISIQSPTKKKIDPPIKDSVSKYTSSKHFHSHHSYQAGDISSRKSPKRRQRLPLASSSSSTESLTSARELTININKRLQPTDRENQDQKCELGKSNGDTSQRVSNNILPNINGEQQVKLKSKSSRLKAIGNQIRFLRRLEKSIKYREKLQSSECSPEDENSEEFNSLELAYPLLRPTVDNQIDEPCQKHIERISFNNSGTTTTEKK